MTIPQLVERIEQLTKIQQETMHQLARLEDNLQELRHQLGVERAPQVNEQISNIVNRTPATTRSY